MTDSFTIRSSGPSGSKSASAKAGLRPACHEIGVDNPKIFAAAKIVSGRHNFNNSLSRRRSATRHRERRGKRLFDGLMLMAFY